MAQRLARAEALKLPGDPRTRVAVQPPESAGASEPSPGPAIVREVLARACQLAAERRRQPHGPATPTRETVRELIAAAETNSHSPGIVPR